jgi:hypothetical protein
VSAFADLRIERAGEDELGVASEVLVEAARWLIDRGQALWKPEDLVPDRLRAEAEEQGRDAGREWLRLDCSAEHPGLASYYEAAGFERHSEGRLGGFRFLRYQKALRVDSRGWTASPPNAR